MSNGYYGVWNKLPYRFIIKLSTGQRKMNEPTALRYQTKEK
ncbi:MAG: hypothetical protein Q8920_02390 [Bacillota bacterium]|nr:hypothetical protein [Bacillota bacterium]